MERLTAAKFRFGDFELDCAHRSLTHLGTPLTLHAKTFDLLQELVENRGTVLSKDELLSRVWRDQFVEENNLTVQISALRKAFGGSNQNFIATIPGRGYSFVAEVVSLGRDDTIVIENRSFSRITVEQEIAVGNGTATEANDAAIGNTESPRPLSANRTRPVAIGVLTVGVIVLLGFTAYLTQGRLFARTGTPPFVRHNVRQLTTNGKVGSAALSPDARMFAYTIDDLGEKSLWVGYVEGGNHLCLMEPSGARYRDLTFSPDGNYIYFSLVDDANPKGSLYRMPVSGGVRTRLIDDVRNFSLSPDGRQIARSRHDEKQGGDHIVVTDLETSNSRDIIFFPGDMSYVPGTISWSPDGKRFALSTESDNMGGDHNFVIVDISTGRADKMGFAEVRDITKTSWLRDGSSVIVTALATLSQASVPQYEIWHVGLPGGAINRVSSDRSNYGASWHNDGGVTLSLATTADKLLSVEHRQMTNVWVAPWTDLSQAREITFGAFGKYDGLWGLDWTPDGRLVYTTSDTNSQFLAAINPDGSGQKPLTETGRVDSVPMVSPDGRYIYFHSNRAPGIDVWRCDIDGANPKQITFGGKSLQPAPSGDGKWVYYRSSMTGVGNLCRAPADGGEPECLNDKSTAWMSFSPDGKYFAAHYQTDKARLAIFSAATAEVVMQFDLPKTGTLYMGTRWTPDSKAVVFRDKDYGYWLQPVEGGGDARKLEGLPKEKFYNFAFSRDGKQFAFVRGPEIRDVVLLENVIE